MKIWSQQEHLPYAKLDDDHTPMPPDLFWIAIGVNVHPLNYRWQRMLNALSALANCQLLAVEGPYVNDASGPFVQGTFWNGVAVLQTRKRPRQLLMQLKRAERKLGRRTERGNRSADFDILGWRSAGQFRTFRSSELTIPHPRMSKRPFVMNPLNNLPKAYTLPANYYNTHTKLKETAHV